MIKYTYLFAFLILFSCNNLKQNEDKSMDMNENSLSEKLKNKEDDFNRKASADIKKLYSDGIEDIRKSQIIENAKNVGDKAPGFILNNQNNEQVKLSDYLKEGPVVLTWYRGGWCPYCNITLKHLTDNIKLFDTRNAKLIALTPELSDSSISTSEKHALKFDVVSDIDNKVASQYGITFKLIEGVANRYEESFGLSNYNGNDTKELPLAATYVISQNGKIVYSFLNADYKKRAPIKEILEALDKL